MKRGMTPVISKRGIYLSDSLGNKQTFTRKLLVEAESPLHIGRIIFAFSVLIHELGWQFRGKIYADHIREWISNIYGTP